MTSKEKKFRKLIIILSVVIPLAVAILFRIKIDGVDFSFLPRIYATINGITAVLLIAGLIAIKKKNIKAHKIIMKSCLALSATFLVMYIMYHMTSDSTPYGGEDTIRFVYYGILISHIILSIAVVPMVLFTYLHAHLEQFDKHRRLARITFPIWLYVAITGVIVYFMISPYYT